MAKKKNPLLETDPNLISGHTPGFIPPPPETTPAAKNVNVNFNPEVQKKMLQDLQAAQNTGINAAGQQVPVIENRTGGLPQTLAVQPGNLAERKALQQLQPIIPPPAPPLFLPQPLNPDIKPSGLDLLDIGSIVGAGVGGTTVGAGIGAGIGSVVPGVGTAAGATVGGIIGAIGAIGTTLFYSSASERKQQTRVSFNNYKDATVQMENVIKDVNAGHYSNMQARMNWDNEYQRILQAERELKMQQDSLFGEKLSKSFDELSKIEAWKRRYARFNFEFESAMAMPDPAKIITGIADTSSDMENNG